MTFGPERNHSEDCRRGMEEEISKDASDTRAEKAIKTGSLVHSRFSRRMSAKEIRRKRILLSLIKSMKTREEKTLMML